MLVVVRHIRLVTKDIPAIAVVALECYQAAGPLSGQHLHRVLRTKPSFTGPFQAAPRLTNVPRGYGKGGGLLNMQKMAMAAKCDIHA